MRSVRSLRGTALFIALAVLSSVLAAAPPSADAASNVDGYELWITSGATDGYLAQPDGDWQWLSDDCRDDVERAGLEPTIKDWGTDTQPGTIAHLRATGERVREPCADLVARLGASVSPPVEPPSEPRVGDLMAPVDVGIEWRHSSEIAVTWTYRSNEHNGFELRARRGDRVEATNTSGKQTRWQTLSGLQRGSSTPYCVEVRATSGTGNQREVSAWAQTEGCENTTPPPVDRRQPVGFTARSILPETVKLTWSLQDSSGNEIDGRVKISRDSQELVTLPAGVSVFFDSGLRGNRNYCYEIAMADGNGEPESDCVRTGTIVDFAAPNPIMFESNGEPEINPAWIAYLEASHRSESLLSQIWDKSGVDRYMNNYMSDFAERLQDAVGKYEYAKCLSAGGAKTFEELVLERRAKEVIKEFLLACITEVWKEFLQQSADVLGFTDDEQLREQVEIWTDYFQANELIIDCLAGTLGSLVEIDLDDVGGRTKVVLQLFKGCMVEAAKSYPLAPWNQVDSRNLTWQDYRSMMFLSVATNAAAGGLIGGFPGALGGGVTGILEHWVTSPYPLVSRVDPASADWIELMVDTFDKTSMVATQQEKAALLRLGQAINCAPGGCGITLSAEHHRRLVTYWTRTVAAQVNNAGLTIALTLGDLERKNGGLWSESITSHQAWWMDEETSPPPSASANWPGVDDTVDGVARDPRSQATASLASFVFGPTLANYGDNVSQDSRPCRYQPTTGAASFEAICSSSGPTRPTLEWVNYPDDRVRVLPADNSAYYFEIRRKNTNGVVVDNRFIGAWGSLETSWPNSDYMCYDVRAINHVGASGWFELPCERPTGVSAVTASARETAQGIDVIDVDWNHDGPAYARFTVELFKRDPATGRLEGSPFYVGIIDRGGTSATMPDPAGSLRLQPGGRYCAFVDEHGSTGSVPSSGTAEGPHCATVEAPPMARMPTPTQVAANLVADDTLSVDWAYGYHGQDGFEVAVTPVNGGAAIVVDVLRGVARNTQVGYDDSRAHTVTVRAYRGSGSNRQYSARSAALTVPARQPNPPTPVPPTPALGVPTNVRAVWDSPPRAVISWEYAGATPAGFDVTARAEGVPPVEIRITGQSARSQVLQLRSDVTWSIHVRSVAADGQTSGWATTTLSAQSGDLVAAIAGPDRRQLNGQTGQPISFQLDGSGSGGDIDFYAWWLVAQSPGIASLSPVLLNRFNQQRLNVDAAYGAYGPGEFPNGVALTYALVVCEGVGSSHEAREQCRPDGWNSPSTRQPNVDLVTIDLEWPPATPTPSPLSAEIVVDLSMLTARDSADGDWPLREGPNGEPGGDLTASVPGGLAAETPYTAFIKVRNNGTRDWPAGGSIYLGSNLGHEPGASNELVWTAAPCGGTFNGDVQRQLVRLCEAVPAGEETIIEFDFRSPDWPTDGGKYRLAFRMYDEVALSSFGERERVDYTITEPADRSGE